MGINKIENPPLMVAHLAGFAAPYGGNFIASLSALDQECSRNNARQIWVFPKDASNKDWCKALVGSGRSVYFFPSRKCFFSLVIFLMDLAAKEKIDVFHSHFSEYDIVAWVASVFLRLRFRRVVVIWHMHSDFPLKWNFLRRLKNFLKYKCMGRFCFSVAASDYLYEKLRALGFPRERLIAVSNGVDLQRAVVTSRSKAQVLRDLNIPDDKVLILMFGWAPIIKGVDVAIEAVLSIVRSQSDVVLGIVGTEDLSCYVNNYSKGNIPAWLYLIPPTETPADYYQCAAIFLSASRHEGFSYALCEAILNKCRVIVSDIPGVQWAKDFRGVKFFKSADVQDLEKRILGTLSLSDEDVRTDLMDSCALVKKDFGLERWCAEVFAFYRRCLNSL
ncbi:MAG: glycosyltransferase family 4 protein [Candidatus Omnitrophica bacterium]|nr:glycosyltransferase family 4 protein [Candidatus Omnitrophota bacterium]